MSYSYRPRRTSTVNRRRPQYGNRNTNSNRNRHSQYIDPSRFVKAATASETTAYEPTHTFVDFALDAQLQANLVTKGYKIPSPIQDQAIPPALEGKDIIGIASTGTGKTAAFGLPLLQKLIENPDSAALIVAPTRELAQQIKEELRELGRGCRLYDALLIGGSNMGYQLKDLRRRPRIIIGTPGRLKDHINRGTLKLGHFNTVVLDEVDRMLDMGFVNDVTTILSNLSDEYQAFFFSATLDNRVRKLIDKFSKEPMTISIKAGATSENVHQDVIRYRGNPDKFDKLQDILGKDEVSKAIVFDETQRGVERLSNDLVARGFSTEAIHGGKSQGQRQRALDKFKRNEVSILVATDVAARGIDVADITHVINFSIPNVYDDYIHRIGRAGRAGQVGYALTFVAG